eukprot:5537619-Pleurochrysis_carterae.AAC.2
MAIRRYTEENGKECTHGSRAGRPAPCFWHAMLTLQKQRVEQLHRDADAVAAALAEQERKLPAPSSSGSHGKPASSNIAMFAALRELPHDPRLHADAEHRGEWIPEGKDATVLEAALRALGAKQVRIGPHAGCSRSVTAQSYSTSIVCCYAHSI